MIVCAMASHPPRRDGMMRVIGDVLGQCDKLYVYLNGYDALPPNWPADPKIEYILAGPHQTMPDVGSHGKFHWIGRDDDAYYVTLDDDMYYPSDYVQTMKTWLDGYQRRVIVTLHGSTFRATNGSIPPGLHYWQARTLYGYTTAIQQDTAVMQAGTAVSIMHPDTLGLTADFVDGDNGSGDDEDLAIWCQRREVPIIRVAGKMNWVRPNNGIWQIEALHQNPAYISAGDAKMRGWKRWKINKVEAQQVIPVRLKTRPKAKDAPDALPDGQCFDKIEPNTQNIEFFNKILSSDALAALVLCAIKTNQPTSVIRAADGERALLEHGQSGNIRDGFLLDQTWLTRYGLAGADLKTVATDLKWAADNATFLACTISGTFWPAYNTAQFFPQRAQFVDQFFPKLWKATDRVRPLLRACPVLVLHRDADILVPELKARYGVTRITGFRLDSWRDHGKAIEAAKASPAKLVLVSGGPSGKALCVRLAQDAGKVALDIGEAMGRSWCSVIP